MNADMQRLCEAVASELGYHDPADGIARAEPLVRAVLDQMREPSRTVLKAMCKAMSPKHRPTPERVSSDEKHRIRWRAAIDAIMVDQ